jgi:hypothetical protein
VHAYTHKPLRFRVKADLWNCSTLQHFYHIRQEIRNFESIYRGARMSKNGRDTVLDLSRLYTHPSAEELIFALDQLALTPPSWDHQSRSNESQDESVTTIDGAGIPKYLTSIVASPLSWIDEDRREQIWERASKRLSERCGRTGELMKLFYMQYAPGFR